MVVGAAHQQPDLQVIARCPKKEGEGQPYPPAQKAEEQDTYRRGPKKGDG